MAINLPPIANPEKVGSFNTNFKMIQDELNNVIRRGGLGVGEPNHMEVDLDMNGNAILNASTDLGNSKSLITVGDADKRYLNDVSADIAGKVDKAGDTMSGTLDMGSNLIRSLLAPLQDNDAATKKYVDDIEASLKAYVDTKIAFMSVSVGDEIGGGIYAGVDTIDGVDFHIISGTADSVEGGLAWKTELTFTEGTDSETDGLANTLAMQEAGLEIHPAAAYCLSYTGGGYTDWHLPARTQATLVYNALSGDPSFSEYVDSDFHVWASTQVSSTSAYVRRWGAGSETFITKHSTFAKTLPIRRVPA